MALPPRLDPDQSCGVLARHPRSDHGGGIRGSTTTAVRAPKRSLRTEEAGWPWRSRRSRETVSTTSSSQLPVTTKAPNPSRRSCSSSSTPPLVPVFLGAIFITYKEATFSSATGMVYNLAFGSTL